MPIFATELSKEILTRSRIHNNCLNNGYKGNRTLYVQQKNYCFSASKNKKIYIMII